MRADTRAVRAVHCRKDFHPEYDAWPATVPAVAQLLREGFEIPAGLTILVGENGSGKSTIIELLAEAYGLNPQGGSWHNRDSRGRESEPVVGHQLQVDRGVGRPQWSYFLRADTTHALYTYLEDHHGKTVEPVFHEMSHGEGFMALLNSRVADTGFYLLDEPDAPLSFTASLGLVALLGDLVAAGSQIVVATHSPIVAATPGATILELGDWGIQPTVWADLQVVSYWRSFLADPERYLRLLAD